MSPFDVLLDALAHELPYAKVRTDLPAAAGNTWWLDAVLDGHEVCVEWSPKGGYGVSATHPDDVGYGMAADETYPTPEAAARRVVELLRTKTYTSPMER